MDEGGEKPDGRDAARLVGAALGRAGTLALDAGEFVARAIAEAASGRPQGPRAGETKLGSIIRYGGTAAGSLLAMTVAAAREAGAGAEVRPAPSPEGAREAAWAGPRARPGGRLRVPLSIDNPGDRAMEDLAPAFAEARHEGAPAAPAFSMRFKPERLTIQPRDFEKLVVTIELAEDIPPGRWSALFTLQGDGSEPQEIGFLVVAAEG